MSIKVTFEFETPEAAADFLMQDSNVDATRAQPAKRGRPTKAAAAPELVAAGAAASPAPVAAAVTAAPAPAASPAVPLKTLVDAVLALAEADMPKAKGILAKYGVTQVTQLKVEQYGAVLAEVQAASTPTPAAATSLI